MSYNVPNIINETLEVISGTLDNVDCLALLSVINSKMANLISSKGCLFKQYSNSAPRTLSYYGISFLGSGMNKDQMIDNLNYYVLPFLEEKLKERVEDYKIEYEEEQRLLRTGKKAEKQIEEELERIRAANLELANVNYTGLFKEAEQLNKTKFGSLYIRISELGDYLDSCVGGDRTKKELMQKLKECYEGTFYPSIIATDSKRTTIKNIPMQAMLYSDYENLYKNNTKEYFISCLRTGLARRCFVRIQDNDNLKLSNPVRFNDKEQAFYKASILKEKYLKIFNTIKENTIYQISEEAKELLYQYQCSCIEYFNNSKDNIIVKLERKESFWKITKLAVVYSVIDNPTSTIVNAKYVQMAIDFYNLISPSLKRVIEKRKKSEIEQFAEYMANKSNDVITRTELRETGIVSSNKFKRFFDEHLDEIKEELENTYGYNLYDYNGKGNIRAFQCMKVR